MWEGWVIWNMMHTTIWVTHKSENNYNCRGSPQQVMGQHIRFPDQAVRQVSSLEKA